MREVVIVDSIRTPIGRAIKGLLKDLRRNDMAAFVLDALLERNPAFMSRYTEQQEGAHPEHWHDQPQARAPQEPDARIATWV